MRTLPGDEIPKGVSSGMSHFSPAKLRQLRERAGLSREELAVASGKSYPSIVGYEAGSINPPIQVLESLADALGTSPREFFVDDSTAEAVVA